MNIFNTIAIVAAGFIAVTAPVAAQSTSADVRVSYADLNLSTSAGQSMLAHRIDAAAKSACAVDVDQRDLSLKASAARCHDAAVLRARTAFAATATPLLASR